MSTLYGIPYMGSKTKIAVDILRQLPKGNRFVDRMPKTNEDGEISEDNTIYVCD